MRAIRASFGMNANEEDGNPPCNEDADVAVHNAPNSE